MWPCLHTDTIYKGILSNDKPAICRMWSSARCQAQDGTPRRNASLAFRLERLQKFRCGVPPFQKVPVWRSGAFRLSLSTDYSLGSFVSHFLSHATSACVTLLIVKWIVHGRLLYVKQCTFNCIQIRGIDSEGCGSWPLQICTGGVRVCFTP